MENQWIIVLIVLVYLFFTSLLGAWQSKKIKKAKDFALTKLSPWQAAFFLAGYTLGGASTYGVAGDTIKFGLTYLVWFPISIALGWWITGLILAKPFNKLQGITLPALLGKRFDNRTRNAATISMMIYAVFMIIAELYTLSTILLAFAPELTLQQATIISVIASLGTVAFSGIIGGSITSVVHGLTMVFAFGLTFVTLLQTIGGWDIAYFSIQKFLPEFAKVNESVWFSPVGLGIGVIGQILLAKSARLGGVSVVSNIAASCKNESETVKAFWLAGLISIIPSFLACGVGVLTAAYLGSSILDMPIYSSIGYAIGLINPIVAGLFLAAVAAAILSTFSPISVTFSTIFVEDIVKQFINVSEEKQKILYPGSIIVLSIISAIYVVFAGIEDIMPFVFSTAFPCTIPNTIVAMFGVHSKKVDKKSAFWAIGLGVSFSLIWGLILNDPFGIQNIYIAFLVPVSILSINILYSNFRDSKKTTFKRIFSINNKTNL